jgi:hypothetical protein
MPPQQNDNEVVAEAQTAATAAVDASVADENMKTEVSEKTTAATPAIVVNEDAEADAVVAAAVDNAIAKAAASNAESYWDAPAEKALEGKTLSTMDVTMLERQHEDGNDSRQIDDDKNNNNNGKTVNMIRPPSSNSFWDWQEGVKKSLSNMSLSNLKRGSHEEHVQQQQQLQEQQAIDGSNGGGYWLWKNASLKNLASTVSLTSLERAVKTKEGDSNNSDGTDTKSTIPRNDSVSSTGSGSRYWFWRNPSMSKMSFSNASLTALEKSAKEGADELNTSNGSNRSSGSRGGGPITNLQHKLRNSWRASFKQLSSNSLSGLDELGDSSRGRAAAAKKEYVDARNTILSERSTSEMGLGNVITCEEHEEEEEDEDDAISCGSGAITF